MRRSDIDPMPEYFDRYILMNDDVDVCQSIQTSLDEMEQFPLEKWKAMGDYVYAPGKWTVRDILQHLIDTERVFSYRALAAARGEKQKLPSFDENEFATLAGANQRSMENLLEEMRVSRRSFLMLYQSFTPEMLQRTCMGFKGEYSVLSIGFIIAGHQRWHMRVLEERYY